MRLDVITIFPEYLAPLRAALLGKAIERGLLSLEVHDLRNWTHDVHRAVDDSPYGGGPGMVMKPQVWGEALDAVCTGTPRLVVPSPAGRPFTQALAHSYAAEDWLVFACGRYEGIDQRVIEARQLEEVSIGDYVLSGGEIAAMTLIDACVRLLPGVMGKLISGADESFSDGLLEYPQYTRPQEFEGRPIPEILLSGDHARVAAWRQAEAEALTKARRPDLWAQKRPKNTTEG